MLSSQRVRRSSKSLVALLLACAAATCGLGCGFDGQASLAGVSPATSPPPSSSSPPGPSSGPPKVGDPDAGDDANKPVTTCTDGVLSFDGTDDTATVPDDAALDLRDDFTVEAWIKPGPRALTDVEMDVVSHHSPTASQGWTLIVRSGRVEVVVLGRDALGTIAYSAGNDGPAYVVPGRWAHVAGVRQGDVMRIYYDGQQRSTQTLGAFFGRDTYAGALRFGRAASAPMFPYQGELDDVRLSKVARYAAATIPKPSVAQPIDASTVAAWRFDEPSGFALVDAAKMNHDGALPPDATGAARVMNAPCISAR